MSADLGKRGLFLRKYIAKIREREPFLAHTYISSLVVGKNAIINMVINTLVIMITFLTGL